MDISQLYRSERDTCVRLAYLLTGSMAVAEDLAQDAFTRSLPKLEHVDVPAAYLRTATANAARDWHRRQRRERDSLSRMYSDTEVSPQAEEMLDVISGLPERQRTVIVLRYWAGMTDAEIAKTLRLPGGTVKSAIFRALRRMRKELEDR